MQEEEWALLPFNQCMFTAATVFTPPLGQDALFSPRDRLLPQLSGPEVSSMCQLMVAGLVNRGRLSQQQGPKVARLCVEHVLSAPCTSLLTGWE